MLLHEPCMGSSPRFTCLQVKRLGPLEPEYGFTSVRSTCFVCTRHPPYHPCACLTATRPPCVHFTELPGSIDKFMALKVKEVQGTTHTVRDGTGCAAGASCAARASATAR